MLAPTLQSRRGFCPGHCRRATGSGSILTPAYSIGVRGLALKNAESSVWSRIQITWRLAPTWPENSEEAVKENLNTK